MSDDGVLSWQTMERVELPFDVELEDWERGAYFRLAEDEYDDLHLELLSHHPGFRRAISALREDLEGAGMDPPEAVRIARHTPEETPYPVMQIAKKWGVAPVDAAALAATEGGQKLLAFERSAIFVEAAPTEYRLRIPGPLTPRRVETVEAWLKEARQRRGEFERRALGDKKKPHAPAALRTALPCFDRWLSGETVGFIYASLPPAGNKTPSEATVRKAIRRVWSHLRDISPEGLPERGP